MARRAKTNNFDQPFTAEGLDSAEVILMMTSLLAKADAGGDFVGGTRVDVPPNNARQNRKAVKQPSNREIIDYLAIGGRDIRPSSKEEDKANLMIANEIVKHMNRVGRVVNNKAKTAEQQVKAGLAGGIRKAMKFLSLQMINRVKAQTVTSGGSARKVSEAYATQRMNGYGVAKSVVFIRTRQLASALNNGVIKIRLNNSKLGKAVRFLNTSTLKNTGV